MVSRENILSVFIPSDNFGSWYPPRRKAPSMDCIIKMTEEGECPGSYRFAYSAENPIECTFQPATFLNDTKLKGYELSIQFMEEDVHLIENSSVSKWFDLLTELEKDRVTIRKAPIDITQTSHEEVRPVLIEIFKGLKSDGKGLFSLLTRPG